MGPVWNCDHLDGLGTGCFVLLVCCMSPLFTLPLGVFGWFYSVILGLPGHLYNFGNISNKCHSFRTNIFISQYRCNLVYFKVMADVNCTV